MVRAEKFLNYKALQQFVEQIAANRDLVVEELWEAPKALLITLALLASKKHIVILTAGGKEGRLFEDFFYFLERPALEFPAWEMLPSEGIAPSPDIVGERYRLLRTLQESQTPQLIFTSLQALFQKVLPPKKLQNYHLVLKEKNEVPFEELPHVLAEMGYRCQPIAADKGEFALRGGIVDLYPVNSPDPFRVEFYGDEIASIRKYDPISQTSVGRVQEILVTPGEELELLKTQPTDQLATLFDYLDNQCVLVFDEFSQLEDKYVTLKEMGAEQSPLFTRMEDFFIRTASLQKLYFTEEPLETLSEIIPLDRASALFGFEALSQSLKAHRWRSPFLPLNTAFCPSDCPIEDFSNKQLLQQMAETHPLTVRFVCQNESEKSNLQAQLQESGLAHPEYEKGYLSSGFYLPEPPLALVPLTELTHRYKIRRQKQRTHYHTLPTQVFSISPGESVVHMNSGIGRYLGIEKRPNHLGVDTEFMVVEYASGGKLYVPMEQASLVSKYIGTKEELPELHTLGSTRWKRMREKTEEAILGYASDLLKLQAERVVKGGFAYPEDSALVKQFAEEFPYEETPDQLLAIKQIKKDMLSNHPMDRLICGDVGYGKTEVAMRAAFKAVIDGGKQVAVLVPTTVLAMQHFDTFSERMGNYPIKIGLLSRFLKPKEMQKTLEAVAEGKVDILIGTHRIVSKDLTFKNLGLVIIDEEQRFGVKAKEHLKQIRKDVDCLTLSATPIPRTLYMSLTGARELSVINTPPEDRLPIQSTICTASEEIIKNALLRELARDGQAYVIHNRVETLFQIASKIATLLPTARIAVGHGQMHAHELDQIFHAFKSGQADILVATSIIENGIDIPNANTILIDRADRFGLADLYQMRGRVGRWNRKAYCYFLVPNLQELPEIARKRLSALTQASGHGGGMKIAMRDLEFRGAGNILGTEQSGHVAAIGFQLYCKLLKKTVSALQKKEQPLSYHEIKVELPYDARLPEEYVNETSLRMDLYQRLGDAESLQEIDDLMIELRDRFGPLPPQVLWLQRVARLRLFAAKNQFTLIKLLKNILIAEQLHGKKNKLTKKLLIAPPKTPEELEERLLKALKENFPLLAGSLT